jgi:XTP/dITP diphosphohydrolase
MKLIFATNNQNKVEEIRQVVGSLFEIITLKEAGIDMDIPEPHDTLEANATEKSTNIYKLTGLSCFGEDTGLEIEALNGEPGVKSARYAGEGRDFQANIHKVLSYLEPHSNRNARFRTVVSLILNGEEHLFEGICNGSILTKEMGDGGFGYDPIFLPDGATKSFGQMDMAEKNRYSHRKKAIGFLLSFLEQDFSKKNFFKI